MQSILPKSINRDRIFAFGRFLWQRFLADKCFETAGALSYTTLFALVPLTAATFAMLSAFPGFEDWRQSLSAFIFTNFVPAAGQVVQNYLFQFASNASRLTSVGVIVLLLSALMMMASIEDRFNRIWRVQTKRRSVSRFFMYWAALTLGPVLVMAGLALTSYVVALPILDRATMHFNLQQRALAALPFVVSWLALFSMYTLIPNRTVPMRYSAGGALIAAGLFELAKFAFTLYVRNVPSYQQIYGTLAVVPIFLVWIYLSWVIVLLGASITASLSAFEYRPHAERLPPGCEFFGLMHVLKHFVAAQREGRGLHSKALMHCERFLTDDLLERFLGDLQRADMIQRNEDGEWVLVRSLDSATLAELYEAGHYRMPLDSDALAAMETGLSPQLKGLSADLTGHMRGALDTRLSEIFPLTQSARIE